MQCKSNFQLEKALSNPFSNWNPIGFQLDSNWQMDSNGFPICNWIPMDFQFPIGMSLLSRRIMYQLVQRGKFEIGKCSVSTFQLDSNGFPVGYQIPIGIQLTIGLDSFGKQLGIIIVCSRC